MHEATVCYLIRGIGRNVEVLLGKRQSLFCNNVWNGPGGKMEPGETTLDCLCREIREEIKVKIHLPSARHFATADFHHPHLSGHKLEWRVHYFHVTRWNGKPKPVNGFSELNWFRLHDLPYSQMMADQKEWLKMAILNDQPNKILIVEIFYADNELKAIARRSLKFTDKQIRH